MQIDLIHQDGVPVYGVRGFQFTDLSKVIQFVSNPPHEEYILSFADCMYHFHTRQESVQFGYGLNKSWEITFDHLKNGPPIHLRYSPSEN